MIQGLIGAAAGALGGIGGGGKAGAAGGGGGGADAAIEKMQAAFDKAIEKSSKVTEITTEAKAELDASKQRPQN